jgi:hypothetical protein
LDHFADKGFSDMTQRKQTQKQINPPNQAGREGKPISLAPLSFDEALDGLLGVKPEPKGEAKKATKKRAMKKR